MISRRTKEALAKKKAEGIVLGRPKGRKSGCVKLTGKAQEIKMMKEQKMSISRMAKELNVNRNTLSAFLKTRYHAELLMLESEEQNAGV